MSTTPCPVQGNADLYGLGIRLGIYTQMLAVQLSSLSSILILNPTYYLSQSTIIFLLATISVLLRELRAHTLQPVEVFPILTLLLAQLRVCRVPLRRGQTTALIYTLELLAIVVLFVWFWFTGMDHMPRACADDKAFFFARVSIWHWFRTLNKVSSVFFAVGGGLAVVAYLMAIGSFAVYRAVSVLRRMGGGPPVGLPTGLDVAVDVDGQLDARGVGVTSVDFLVNVGAIVYVEVSLKWNHIVGVQSLSSAGQFMPFFVSLAQLLAVLYDGARSGLKAVAEDGNPNDLADDDEHGERECPHGGGWLTKGRHQTLPLSNIQPK